MKRTLLDDILQVYNSIPCLTNENSFCTRCANCKNRIMCNMISNLIDSMIDFY